MKLDISNRRYFLRVKKVRSRTDRKKNKNSLLSGPLPVSYERWNPGTLSRKRSCNAKKPGPKIFLKRESPPSQVKKWAGPGTCQKDGEKGAVEEERQKDIKVERSNEEGTGVHRHTKPNRVRKGISPTSKPECRGVV